MLKLDMHSESSSEYSDSDTSLPDISEFFSPRSQNISPGDIVWAKYKHLYWPALVRAYYPNQKKISIWYCDEPGKTFKLPLKNVYLFHDSDMYTKILKDVKDAGVLKEHQGLTSHASSYLRRKQDGYEDDPMKFFDQTYPFFLVEEMLKKNPNADVSDIKIRPMYIDNAKKETIRKRVSARNNESDDSELECADSDSETKTNTGDFISNVNVQLHNKSSGSSKEIDINDVDIDEIVKCILSGKADDHLQKVKLKKIPSEHHDLYEKSLKSKRKNVSEISFTGPINNDCKLRKLIFYLLPLYEKMDNPLKNECISSEKGKALAISSSFKDKNTDAQYVASVFLPESIIFAISKVKNISLAAAKKLFVGKSECRTKAIESILAHADRYIQAKERTECLVENVLQSKKCGTSKRRSEDDVHLSKKVCMDKSDTICDEKEILTTGLKPKKCVKISDAVKSSETSSSKNEYEDKILSCILSGKADDYLKKIKLKCIPSKHLDLYEESVKGGKKKLCNITYTGPVKDDAKLRMLMLYLLPLYDDDDAKESHRSKRSAAKKCKSAMAAYYIDEKNPAIQYVINVWLPESIILAVSEIENVDLSEAKKLFDKYAEAKPVASLLKSLDHDFSG